MAEAAAVYSADVPAIRRIGLERPWAWLAAGWRDLAAYPAISLSYGLVFALCGLLLLILTSRMQMWFVAVPLAAGFMLLGPVLAVGLYDVSRRRQCGEPVTFALTAVAWRRNPSQLGLMALALMLFFLVWIRLATLIFALFYGYHTPPLDTLVQEVFFSTNSLAFLIVGNLTGAILAALVFAISAVSIPMLLDRDVDAVAAIGTSLRVVQENPGPMAAWAALIVLFTAAGMVVFFVGLIVALPLIGHATWHCYRDLIGGAPD